MNSPLEARKKSTHISPYLVLAIGVMAVSTAAIIIRFAQNSTPPTPSLVIAAIRLSLAGLILTPIALRNHRPALRALSRKDFGLAVLSGLILSIHFASWITSLEHTSVLISVVLVTTTPLWVALFSPILIREPLNRRAVIGILVAFGGSMLISIPGDVGDIQTGNNRLLGCFIDVTDCVGDIRTEGNQVVGALLATVGAVAASLYLIIGRKLRASLALIPYIWLCYGTAAIVLMITVFLTGNTITGYGSDAYLAMLLLAVLPQLVGHSSFNYALAHMSAAYTSLATLVEPVGSAILAAIFFSEFPVPVQIIGASLILFAVAFARENGAPEETQSNVTEVIEP